MSLDFPQKPQLPSIKILREGGSPARARSESDSRCCVQGHQQQSFLARELAHVREHWLSCLISCVFVHLVLDALSQLVNTLLQSP